jgi:hypothetical protein
MRQSVAAVLVTVLLASPSFAQQKETRKEQSAAGQWRVEFVTPLGQRGVTMTINQSGARLSGHVVDEFGEYEISGRLAGDEVTVVWSVPEDGKMLEITMRGKLEGNVINGTAKLGDVGEGPLSARRVGDAGDEEAHDGVGIL